MLTSALNPPRGALPAMLWLLLALLVACVAWTVFGTLDVVATAPARLVPQGRVKVIQALEQSVVQKIHVQEGARVDAGTLLLSLDPGVPLADEARLQEDMLTLSLARTRLRDLLQPQPDTDPFASLAARVPDLLLAQEQARHAKQRAEQVAGLEGLDGELRAIRARLAEAVATRRGIEAELALLGTETQRMASLVTEGYLPWLRWAQHERERRSLVARAEATRAATEALWAESSTLRARREGVRVGFEQRWLAELAEVEVRLTATEAELAKARRRLALTQLRAPVSGTVQELVVHTEGGVVPAAAPLLRLVPADAGLEVEARISHRDIGFVQTGQAVVVKLATFDFTRYGHLRGRVETVTRDAVTDANGDSGYTARIRLLQGGESHTGARLDLLPGMAGTVDIHLGERRIVDFILSPLRRRGAEGGRER